MSSRGVNDLCRVCAGALQGNQRRWLFGGQGKKNGQASADPPRGRSPPRSSPSSPWGSTSSLGSSVSLSKYQSSPRSSSKGVDLLSVLTHILGSPVQRGGSEQGEFVCGKCVCVLERVFRFDAVIARVRVLSTERLQKLMHERDKIRQWVRQNYRQRHPGDLRGRGSSAGEEDGEAEKEGYREMLRDNMALSEYECWSEKWDTCPYFIRTGKRCRKGKGCEGCDSFRVSDSDYESVCGVPRRLPPHPFSPLALSRDRSRSMPLNWQRGPPISISPPSPAGSGLSSHASSRTVSMRSLDSLDNNDPFDPPDVPSAVFVLKELKSIERKPVSSPSGSRIPVLGGRDSRHPGRAADVVNRALDFGDVENGGDEALDADVLTELRDEFVPLRRESATGKVHHAVRQLRGQLDQAVSRVRTLEAELKRGTTSKPTEVNGSEDWAPLDQGEGGGSLLQSFGLSLHSRERLIQECMSLIRRLCVEDGAAAAGDELTSKLTESLKEMLSDNKAALGTLRSETAEREKGTAKEMEALREAGRDRERDLDTLNTVLQCNQDIIDGLRVVLEEKERLLQQVEKERQVWRQRERALGAALQEKDAAILYLRGEPESRQKSARESAGGGPQLAATLEDRVGNGDTLCKEIATLTATLQEYQDMMQNQQESHRRTVTSLTAELGDARQALREKEKEKKEADRARQNTRDDRGREETKLRHSLEKRDKLIEQILLDAEDRDRLLGELQQNLQNTREPLTAFRHTL